MQSADLPARTAALGQLLHESRGWWSPRPFVIQSVPWEAEFPALSARLRNMSEAEVEARERSPMPLDRLPSPMNGVVARLPSLVSLPEFPPGPGRGPNPTGTPARKWSQIVPFLEQVRLGPGPFVDWCAGKGHLGRLLSRQTGRAGFAVERDPALCLAGEELALEEAASLSFRVADVLNDELSDLLDEGSTLLALHSCGLLGDRALQLSVASGARVYLAPCCFHRTASAGFQARSAVGQRTGLNLDREDLRLPSTEEVVAGTRIRRLRRDELAWRAAVDLLLREATGEDCYHALPRCPPAWLSGGFSHFLKQMVIAASLPLDSHRVDLAHAERAGRERSRISRALGLIRVPFRRAVEVWLAFDRAQGLVEQGQRVELGTFCPREVTPRNILLRVESP